MPIHQSVNVIIGRLFAYVDNGLLSLYKIVW